MKGVYVFLLIVMYSSVALCQEQRIWAEIGTGYYFTFDNNCGFTTINDTSGSMVFPGYLGLTLARNRMIYQISFIRNEELDIFDLQQPDECYNNLGFLIGKGINMKYLQFHFSCGPGLTWGIRRGELINNGNQIIGNAYNKVKFTTFSIHLHSDILVVPFKYAAAGCTTYLDMNIKRPYFGIALKLSLGVLR